VDICAAESSANMFLNLELLFFMVHEGQNAPASEAGGAGGGGPGNRTPHPL